MLNISMTSEALERLQTILSSEGDDAVVRVRETKVGCGCKSHVVLMLSIDEREREDVEGEAESLPFVANQEIVDQYGHAYSVSLDEHKMLVVFPQNWPGYTAEGNKDKAATCATKAVEQ